MPKLLKIALLPCLAALTFAASPFAQAVTVASSTPSATTLTSGTTSTTTLSKQQIKQQKKLLKQQQKLRKKCAKLMAMCKTTAATTEEPSRHPRPAAMPAATRRTATPAVALIKWSNSSRIRLRSSSRS
jgi:hypothetical protein